jgi:ribulose-bisphosphate carboxylase small chain
MASTIAAQAFVPCASAKAAAPRASLKPSVSLKAANAFAMRTVSNGAKTRQMLVWQPTDNKYFETFSFLPPLSANDIAKQVDYIIRNGWIPSLEFAEQDKAYAANTNTGRMGAVTPCYYDNRYWTMYKLPMFGCSDPSQVLKEIDNCTRSFPDAYIRLVAFDNKRQVQVGGLLVHRPPGVRDFRKTTERSI